ncbi:MAG: hypothetical protein FWG92_01180 [Leptospirales bacterium]|nr:hypothetical protein [Leptospirales bacterium]
MDKNEINLIVSKIRETYQDYAKKYGQSFQQDSFEERYQLAIKNRMELEGFLLSEIAFLEKLKEKYDKKAAAKAFTATVDSIIEENTARVKKYPKIEFHPKAHFEICHFYGAMNDFAKHYFEIFRIIGEKDTTSIEDELTFLVINAGKRLPKRIQDHAMMLSRHDIRSIDIERDASDYLRACASLLHKVANFCEELLEKRTISSLEAPLRFNKVFIEDSSKKALISIFSGLTGYGAILKVNEQAQNIIADFRLKAFK